MQAPGSSRKRTRASEGSRTAAELGAAAAQPALGGGGPAGVAGHRAALIEELEEAAGAALGGAGGGQNGEEDGEEGGEAAGDWDGLCAAGGGARKRIDRSERLQVLRTHTIRHLANVRRQHLTNLTALMRQSLLRRDVPRLASVVSLLLAAQGPGQAEGPGRLKVAPGERQRVTEAQARLAEALAAGYTLLRDAWPPAGAGPPPSGDQLKRLLRQAHAYQPTAAAKDGVGLELARLMLAQGDLPGAYDVIEAMPPRGDSGPLEFDKALLGGLVRHAQWAQAMQRSESRRPGAPSAPAFDALSYDPSQWARAGRQAKELFQEAGALLQRAYRLRPASTELAYLLVQRALVSEEGVAGALLVAQRHRQVAPADVDAHALHALLLVMAAGRRPGAGAGSGAAAGAGAGGALEVGAPALLGCLEAMLRCDPGNEVALAAVMELHDAGALASADLLRLLCTTLDSAPPSFSPPRLQLRAWRLLSERVRGSAQRLVDAHSAVQQSQQLLKPHLAALLPPLAPAPAPGPAPGPAPEPGPGQQGQGAGGAWDGTGCEGQGPAAAGGASQAQRQQGGQGSAASGAQERGEGGGGQGAGAPPVSSPPRSEGGGRGGALGEGPQLDPAEADRLYRQLGEEQQELDAAAGEWQELAGCLQCCLWWRQHHFTPPPPEGAVLALRTGRASAAVLGSMAVVCAAVHGLWLQQRLRAVSQGERLPSVLRNEFTRSIARVLREHGAAAEAGAVRQALKTISHALRVARAMERQPRLAVLGVLAQQAKHRADFWRAARKPWKPPRGWLAMPLGQAHPVLGPIADLAPAWWRAFPHARRRGRQSS